MPNISNFNQDAYPATDETQCLTVYIPAGDEFKWLFAGLISLATRAANYMDPESEQARGLADIWRDAYDLTDWEGCQPVSTYGSQVDLFARFITPYVGSSLVFSPNTSQPFALLVNRSTAAIGDAAYQGCYLEAGEYQATFLFAKTNNSGKITILLANEETFYQEFLWTDLEMYQAGASVFNQTAIVNFTLTEPVHRAYFICGTKTVASGGYQTYMTCLNIQRTDLPA